MGSSWKRLGKYLWETQILGSVQSTLYWDQNTSMPFRGASWRGEQLSLLARQLHSRQSSIEYGNLIEDARAEFENQRQKGNLVPAQVEEHGRNLYLLEQDFRRQKSLDSELVSDLASAKSEGYSLWQQARKKSDFSIFVPALQKLIQLRQEEARQLSEPRSCWETLAQPFEPDITLVRIKELFNPLRKRLPELLSEVRELNERRPLNGWDLSENDQQNLCNELLNEWGREDGITSIARSPHPFSTTLGPCDFRLTTRIVKGQPFSCFLATAHEWGHSLYEQGLPCQSHHWFGWPLGKATSMSVHESQSLFWENRVARSMAFSERWWKRFANVGAPINCSEELWRLMNPLIPGLTRVEADELSYGLHILIRTDLEIALLEQGLEVEALPSEWNLRYKELIGITPGNDKEGCLQDVHWSEGLFGYFPSYLLGHLISAQLAESMNKDFEDHSNASSTIDGLIENGKESTLLDWLRNNVHCHGRQLNAEQLVQKVTEKRLSSEPFLKYLENKVKNLMALP